ncbi:MAG: metallophosphoesterase [Paludibacteraceae bacterium]|nr:metallophosphoesterase [Paludibacteraceae bacterium]MBO7315934.1 metallophosphoesterase [Paludibacteraceae bacterium]
MLIILCIIAGLILAIVPNFLWLLGWIGCKIAGVGLPYRYFGIASLIIVILFWSALAYGYFWGRWKVESVALEYTHKDIPKAFDGFKIVHISDLHLSTFDDSPERLNIFIEEINKQFPDIVCFTGDMVTIGKSEAEPYTDILKKISAIHGVLSVLGNHDFMIYSKHNINREMAVDELAEYQENILGWKLLRNENIVIESIDGSKITFIGVDNANFDNQGFPTIHHGDLKKAMKETDGFRILLTHDPSHWKAEVLSETDIPLTLSGHTHSAQIKIFGWTPAKWSFDEIAGRYDNGEQTLYINVGLGCTAPFRIGVNPEVTVITLRSANKDIGLVD